MAVTFFSMPAVTTAAIGWQILEAGDFSSQFVYGMGFSMNLFPNVFRDFVYWINRLFQLLILLYSERMCMRASRGAFNTGLRIHPIKGRKIQSGDRCGGNRSSG